MLAVLAVALGFGFAETKAQSVLFDFDNAPLHTSLPVDLTVGGITAHFSGNPGYYNYSIQRADALGFTPPGFSGYCIYPNTIYPCDLLISFNRQLTAASILYSPEEYDTDSSCRMRITAYWERRSSPATLTRSIRRERGPAEHCRSRPHSHSIMW